MTSAEKMLSLARLTNQGRPEGTVTSHVAGRGDVVVTWKRPQGVYEVGTEARSLVTGPRRVVLPVLERLVAGAAL